MLVELSMYESEENLRTSTQITYFGAEVIENVNSERDIPRSSRKRHQINSEESTNDDSTSSTRNANNLDSQSPSETSPDPIAAKLDRMSEFFTYTNICAMSMMGCIIRIGLEKSMDSAHLGVESSDYVIFQAFIANMVGSFILGVLTGSTLKKIAGMLPVSVGISTGLCGSITTFSKFNQQVSLMIVGDSNPSGNRYFTAFLSILLGLAAPTSSFIFGHDLSTIFSRHFHHSESNNGTSPKSLLIAKIMNYFLVTLLILSWFTLLILAIIYRKQYYVILNLSSVLLAPFGALCRFALASLNKKQYMFEFLNPIPIGTLFANLLGSLVLSAVSVTLIWVELSCGWTALLNAIGSGFCACLTTVSTLISEIQLMRGEGRLVYSHIYPLCTICLCLGLSTVMNGVSYSISSDVDSLKGNNTCS